VSGSVLVCPVASPNGSIVVVVGVGVLAAIVVGVVILLSLCLGSISHIVEWSCSWSWPWS
jgi:hypothetical protein